MKTGTFSRVIRLLGITQVPEVELSMNTLIDRNDYLGLFYSDPEPRPFFSFDKKENEQAKRIIRENKAFYQPILFSLSDTMNVYERDVYSFMEALGDFGGFADGIVMIPAIFMKMYSSRMYLQSLFSLLPIKASKSSAKSSRYRAKK